MSAHELKNAFTIDVEDYFHVEGFANVIDKSQWDNYPCRVEANMDKLLDLMEENNIKGTFFILGWVAVRYPQIVRNIAEKGHEVASHGMSHQLIYTQDRNVFRQETLRSKALLEDISQQSVIGYRAATYSIVNDTLWALDELVDAGFLYDSSIFPMRHDRYGIPGINPLPHKIYLSGNRNITEFPISVVKKAKMTLPVAGGGYFRLLPYWLTKWGLNEINKDLSEFMFYIHPWEIDVEQPRINDASALSKFRHYLNINKSESRLKKLFNDFKLTTMKEVLKNKGLLSDVV